MARVATIASTPSAVTRSNHMHRTFIAASFAHALHDGYTGRIYVLFPVWQAERLSGRGILAPRRPGARLGLDRPRHRGSARLSS